MERCVYCAAMTISIADICRYPVKGLAADHPSSVTVAAGAVIPFDRRFALVHASSRVDKAQPDWAQKNEFLMLARDEKLAQLGIEFDADTADLTITRKGKSVSRGVLTDQTGRTVLQTFLAAFMPDGPRGKPVIVEAPEEKSFSDVPANLISIINLATVKDIERVVREPVDPLRFRGNLYLEGLPAWQESSWVGKDINIGNGVVLHVQEPIGRCAATNVDPATGQRDLNIPLTLRKGFGHTNCGVYAKVKAGGTISIGDTVSEPG
ncbi:MOSC domain-containing protein [Hwanghaeella sp.]|uniref:MOSC domain-containing protein n=1 Tax=Hwanghaeella sp. TaxID=2605943 RepID=UPI003CCC2958